MRRPIGPLTPWRYCAPTPSPETRSMSRTSGRQRGSFSPSARNANKSSGARSMVTACSAMGIARLLSIGRGGGQRRAGAVDVVGVRGDQPLGLPAQGGQVLRARVVEVVARLLQARLEPQVAVA